MTYRELQNQLKNLSERDADRKVTILINGEYLAVADLSTAPPEDDDIFEAGHPILRLWKGYRGM